MSTPRLAPLVLLLLAACAGWDSATPSHAPPPVDGPTPSHYVPPLPVDPTGAETPPPEAPGRDFRVAVASVQLRSDCPDPVAAPSSPSAASELPPDPASAGERSMRPGDSDRHMCTQSMVQLAVNSEFAGQFRVEAVRVLDPTTLRVAGTSTLRLPTQWTAGSYAPWDARVVPGVELNVSYKLGALDLSRASEQTGPAFDTYGAPYILEIDVAIDGARKTIRSAEFRREPEHIMVT